MRKKLFAPVCLLLILLSLSCSCDAENAGSIKTITKPYVNEYVCTYAMLGERNLLEEMEYIKVIFSDGKTLQVSYKKSGGEKHAFECGYTRDEETGELLVDFGIFGADNKPKIIIKDGKFSINKQLGKKLLVMIFEVV